MTSRRDALDWREVLVARLEIFSACDESAFLGKLPLEHTQTFTRGGERGWYGGVGREVDRGRQPDREPDRQGER